MEKEDKSKNKNKGLFPGKGGRPNYQLYFILALVGMVVLVTLVNGTSSTIEIAPMKFQEMMLSNDVAQVVVIKNKDQVEVTLKEEAINNEKYKRELEERGPFSRNNGPHYTFQILSVETFVQEFKEIENRIPQEDRIGYKIDSRSDVTSYLLNWGFLFLILFGFWFLMRRMTGSGGPGGQIFNIGKSKAALFDSENQIKTSFKDIAGIEEAKEEVKEIVEFLKEPSKFTKLGGKIPKGALLVGAPGTGKTLLAKAVAGEAGVPFFSLSGSDFVEMFVGVGAARVRDLFKQAKEKAPAIIFIDEIDAIGRTRGRGQMPGANDERENTLNSLLVEMDGFSTDSGVIILGATNRPDVLDSALLRPGRFDRQITIDKPDIAGRGAIFRVHMKNLTLSKEVDPRKLAAQTPGFAGAEIANVCNEAALIAARKNKNEIEMIDFQDAIDRVIGGLEKKTKIISPEEKKIVAYHESGHAIAGWYLEHADPLVKISIVPRGIAALGYAQYLPKEQFLHTTEQLFDELCMALGGRAAEEIIFGTISTGALSDLERITKVAYGMVTIYGMNKKIGNISFYDSKQSDYSFIKPYSEATAQTIDEEVRNIVDKAYKRTKSLLLSKKKELKIIAKRLLEKEVIFQADLVELIGKRPFEKPSTYDEYVNSELKKEEEEKAKKEAEDKNDTEQKSSSKEEIASTNSNKESDHKPENSEVLKKESENGEEKPEETNKKDSESPNIDSPKEEKDEDDEIKQQPPVEGKSLFD